MYWEFFCCWIGGSFVDLLLLFEAGFPPFVSSDSLSFGCVPLQKSC
jgi:hypothetical protein